MKVVQFPSSGLTERDIQALKEAVARRQNRGLPGHVTRGAGQSGHNWAAILDRPGGRPLQHFCREQGIYYLLDFTGPSEGRVVDASRRFDDMLRHLPGPPPSVTRT